MGKKSRRRTAQTKVNNKANVLTAELDTQLVQGVKAVLFNRVPSSRLAQT